MNHIKKSLKYIAIASINLVLIWCLTWLTLDDLHDHFTSGYFSFSYLPDAFLFAVTLLVMKFLSIWINNKRPNWLTKRKILYASAWTILISAYVYFGLLSTLVQHHIIQDRDWVETKFQGGSEHFFNGGSGAGLAYSEYQVLVEEYSFRSIPAEARNISFSYWYEGFLPDFSISLTYDLPADYDVKPLDVEEDQYERSRVWSIEDGVLRVRENEFRH